MEEKELAELVEKRAGGSPSQRISWQKALGAVRDCGCGDRQVRWLAELAEEPGNLLVLARHWRAGLPDAQREVMQEVERSEASEAGVLAAFVRCTVWLEQKNKEETPDRVAGFIRCCDEARQMEASAMSLRETVEKFLKDYGIADL